MPYAFLAIGLGAALGAWARWGLSLWLNPAEANLPLGTLAANLIGGYGVGLAVAWFDGHAAIAPEWRLFAITGLLGGLTTFSTFSAEVTQQLLRQQYGWALAMASLHLFGSLAMTALGMASVRAGLG
ncbi:MULTISPECIES: fluoride efflux transporter CrcB [unclassified Lysobacter]|uniref:fluoride efflux transporter CrcB n=1 Tax=unclassified Lysobacter TaxID=2635362 RepID=UPI0006F57F18|nr:MULTISPECIES: fluoride efflux transporter CrcB [unclassified Lysobacter]KRC33984.1 camphor resistance protein CrcB [Lysobacter sp. Root76]KRD69318.1 camphor resistance protein CrcB [Lysobacter sp. Root96]